ncbi:hypothetical protein BIT35_29215 [Klebsiella pneumoniae]|nr:hypothetical protein BIT35_29215 [Klebsiella pneumoniae]
MWREKMADLARMEAVLSELVCACHARKGTFLPGWRMATHCEEASGLAEHKLKDVAREDGRLGTHGGRAV